MSTNNNTICILPWIHTYVGSDGNVLPCCIADQGEKLGNVRKKDLIEIWNDIPYTQLRYNMINGIPSKECSACYKAEKSGTSFRQEINERYSNYMHLIDRGVSLEMKLRYLDVRWSNICNFKCRTCSSTFSSSWAQENGEKNIFVFAGGNDNTSLYEQFESQLEYIEEIYFAGGEPLLMDMHYKILLKLIELDRTDVKLRYSTNLSTLYYKKNSIVDLWKQFYIVQIYVSLDSWGDRAEYIREGTVWKDVVENIKTIKADLPDAYIATSTVVSVFNVLTLPEFLDNIKELFGDLEPTFYIIQQPEYYSFSVLHPDLKASVSSKLSEYSVFSSIVQALQQTTFNYEDRERFIDETQIYDAIRDRDFFTTFPELNNI